MNDKEKIKSQVLTDNTAQGVLNKLRVLESDRARVQMRWIWELMQNARDTSSDVDSHLVTKVKLEDDELVFQHNGRGFTIEEVAHLNYHGSTKLEDKSTIGQYGSGFLTTHLLSPEIVVSGQLDDGRSFSFRLSREIGSVQALSDSMDKAWDDFHASAEASSESFTTKYSYPVSYQSRGAVDEGISILRRCAAYVVVLNRQFRSIIIESSVAETRFEVIERIPLGKEGLQAITVGVSDRGSVKKQEFILSEDQRVSVTVPVEQTNDGSVCLPLGEIPRLFLGFPLVGTENFSFPAVINSFEFTATERRDGVFLGRGDNEANQTNQAIVQEACELHVKLIEFFANAQWKNTYALASIPSIAGTEGVDSDWLQERLGKLVSEIRRSVTLNSAIGPIAPQDSIVPLATTDVEPLWELLSKVRAFRSNLPERSEAVGWHNAVESWAGLLNRETMEFDEGYDGTKLVSTLVDEIKDDNSEYGTLAELENALQESVDAVEWLDELYSFLKDDGLDNVIREFHIVLDQAGFLDRISNLYRDDDIDNELKDIGDDVLGLDIRCQLRDTRLTSLADEIGKGEYGNNRLINEITEKLNELCDESSLSDEYILASPRLFAWFVTNQESTHLRGFPTFSVGPDDGGQRVLRLGQAEGHLEVPLAPTKSWEKDLQEYADLFPPGYIMSEDFFTAIPEVAVWQELSEEGFVRTDVLINSEKTIGDFLPAEPLQDREHKTVDAVAATDVFLLTKERVGVMSRVRDSQVRARLFWRFLTEWLVTHDPKGVEIRTEKCECGVPHEYYPATWLVPVVRNNWVPQGNDIRDRATAQSLAKLLRGSGWTPDSLSDSSASVELMKAIRVSHFDLMRHFVVSDDEQRSALDDTLTHILVSTGGDLSHVRDFVDDMETDGDLIEDLAKRRERRRVVHENQILGDYVEELVKEALEDEGFSVQRTGIGSDYEIEYDLIEEDTEIGIELSRNNQTWLVEVKATREVRVRMTAKQAVTAVNRGNGFLLCVVSLVHGGTDLQIDDIRANMRFVQNIGPRVEPLCQELDALNHRRDHATTPSDSDIQLEIEAGTARIRVDKAVWQDGVSICDLAAKLK